jgi:NAD(P)H-quinone oxidoreductase subunit I
MTFLKRVKEYVGDAFRAAKYIGQGMGVVFDHMGRRPVTVQYPFEKLIPSERFRGRIHFEFDKCIACEICVRVCPIDLPVVDWAYNPELKKKELTATALILGCAFSVPIVWSFAPPTASR